FYSINKKSSQLPLERRCLYTVPVPSKYDTGQHLFLALGKMLQEEIIRRRRNGCDRSALPLPTVDLTPNYVATDKCSQVSLPECAGSRQPEEGEEANCKTTPGNARKMKNPECEKMGGVCKHQKTHGCTILPAECKSRKKHCCRA
ncbi:hypothetical protein E2I00_016594, partial [Balaenoptera physalus]